MGLFGVPWRRSPPESTIARMLSVGPQERQASPVRAALHAVIRSVARGDAALMAAVALVAAGLYLPALRYGLVWDDLALLGPEGPAWLGGNILPYRPVRWLSYWVDFLLGGGAVAAYHSGNVILHAMVAGLVVLLGRRLGAGRVMALSGGLVVASHPLAVESVAYVSGRRDLLVTFFGLAAVLAVVPVAAAAAERRMPPGRAAWLPWVLFLAAVGSKETGMLWLPAVAAGACGPWGLRGPLGPRGGLPARHTASFVTGKHLIRPMVAGALVAAVFALAYGAHGPLVGPRIRAMPSHLAKVSAHYADSLFLRAPLAPDYPALTEALAGADPQRRAVALEAAGRSAPNLRDRARRYSGAGWLQFAFLLAGTAGVFGLVLRWGGLDAGGGISGAGITGAAVTVAELPREDSERRSGSPARRRSIPYTDVVALALVLPVLWGGLWAAAIHEPGADRHAYPILAALCVALAALGSRAMKQVSPPRLVRATGAVAVLVVLGGLAIATARKLPVWASERALWEHTVSVSPRSARARLNLAAVQTEAGQYDSARYHLRRLVQRQSRLEGFLPDVTRREASAAWAGLASLRCLGGRRMSARDALTQAHRLGANPDEVRRIGSDCGLPEFGSPEFGSLKFRPPTSHAGGSQRGGPAERGSATGRVQR